MAGVLVRFLWYLQYWEHTIIYTGRLKSLYVGCLWGLANEINIPDTAFKVYFKSSKFLLKLVHWVWKNCHKFDLRYKYIYSSNSISQFPPRNLSSWFWRWLGKSPYDSKYKNHKHLVHHKFLYIKLYNLVPKLFTLIKDF